jgi:hypothetical protein
MMRRDPGFGRAENSAQNNEKEIPAREAGKRRVRVKLIRGEGSSLSGSTHAHRGVRIQREKVYFIREPTGPTYLHTRTPYTTRERPSTSNVLKNRTVNEEPKAGVARSVRGRKVKIENGRTIPKGARTWG